LGVFAFVGWAGVWGVDGGWGCFVAVRIAVNDEIGQLERSLPLLIDLLAPGGRLGIISFHSLEDRVVKQFLKDHAGNRYDADLTLTTNRPITASPDELVFNPRSRSAKLRVAVKKNKNT
jgi:16S rRNA (cytosine1402-N4)-methyltransferase